MTVANQQRMVLDIRFNTTKSTKELGPLLLAILKVMRTEDEVKLWLDRLGAPGTEPKPTGLEEDYGRLASNL